MTIAVVDMAGDAFSRGKAFGSARGEHISAFMRDWMESLRAAGVGDPLAYLARLLEDTGFVSAIREHAPDLLEEVRGIASGAGQPMDLVLASQLMDEEWAYRPHHLRRGEATQKCSSVAIVSDGGPTWIGQNMDLGGYTDGHQVAMRIAADGERPGALVFTIGGMVGLLGVNSLGIGVCVNSLPQLPATRAGLPVALVIRRLLQARSEEEVVHFVRTVRHATGQHYLMAGQGWIRSFEASPAGVSEYHAPDPRRVLHTNHPLAAHTGMSAPTAYHVNSAARMQSLLNRLSRGVATLEAIKAALSSSDDPEHPVCRLLTSPGQHNASMRSTAFTTGSLIATLDSDASAIETWISAGPPAERGYEQVSLLRS